MVRSIRPYFQLVRLPNLFTAAADPLAGWILGRGSLDQPGRWVPLVFASVLIYAGGIVLNDVFDIEIDRRERPQRPLPSSQVRYRLAVWFGVLVLGSGPLIAWLSGSTTSALVAGVLALTVLAYDSGMKRTWFGPLFMGACRSGNLLLGFSQLAEIGGPYAWSLAACFGLFVAGLTWISRSEVGFGRRAGIVVGFGGELIGLVGLAVVALLLGQALNQTQRFPLLALVLWLVLFQIIARTAIRAIRVPEPATVQRAVKTGVLSLVWLDVALVASAREPVLALAVAILWVPAYILGRWLYST